MTKEGSKIPDLTKGRGREQLADETDSKAIKRLTAAREYLEELSSASLIISVEPSNDLYCLQAQ